ncbi:MAG TPA: MYXO-CTERM sorting domain-containing protein, partial [Anaeromyxobacter sp.]|nr:MYXO-CTERM sorting domain-containing protein [Anaeromyxobacter sp.]
TLMAAREELARRIVALGATAPTPEGEPLPLPPSPPPAEGAGGGQTEASALPVVGGCASGGGSGFLAVAGLLGTLRLRRRRAR